MSGSRLFPIPLQCALLGPLALWGAAWLLGMMIGRVAFTERGLLVMMLLAAVVQVVAVLVAIFLLVRRGPYVRLANILMTLAAAFLPLLFGAAALVFFFGHVHM